MLPCDLVHKKISIFALEMVAYDPPLARAHVGSLGYWWGVTKKNGRGKQSHSMLELCAKERACLKKPKFVSVFMMPQENCGCGRPQILGGRVSAPFNS